MGAGAVSSTMAPIENDTTLKKFKDGLLSATSSEACEDVVGVDSNDKNSTVSITVVGASGDLAKKKIFPALFALFYEDCLPEVRIISVLFPFYSLLKSDIYISHLDFFSQHFTVFGYARSKMTDAELRNMVSRTLTCRIDKR